MSLLLENARIKPYDHQEYGVDWLAEWANPDAGRVFPGCALLADEMGAGKTKQVIDTACLLHARGEINLVIVVAPAAVRGVWYDEDIGEIQKHLWRRTYARVHFYHNRRLLWEANGDQPGPYLTWIITNYEFIRGGGVKLKRLLDVASSRTLLVLDESAAVKNYASKQNKTCRKLREQCGRVILLNGTPITNSPGDAFGQAVIMDPRIFGSKWYEFRGRYANMGGFKNKQIVSWRNLDDIRSRLAPYVLRRLKKDCIDLPPKLPPSVAEVPLTKETWRIYCEMRDDLVTWLDEQTVAVSPQAGVRVMRLAQITSGFLGGLTEELDCPACTPEVNPLCPDCGGTGTIEIPAKTREVGTEKLKFFMGWVDEHLENEPTSKIVVWCRFRDQLARAVREVAHKYGETVDVGCVWGSQPPEQRARALRLLKPTTADPTRPAVVFGTPQSGAVGLDFAAAQTSCYLSNDYSFKTRAQSEDRIHRPGQVLPVSYLDVIAVGPNGESTVDRAILSALQSREETARWTCEKWIQVLKEG